MTVSVTMPRLGESVTEGTVSRWLKQEGERVEVDEPLLEVSTDKVDTEVPSPAAGILQSIKVAEDETVDIGVELAVISDGSDAGDDAGDGGSATESAPSTGADAGDDADQTAAELAPDASAETAATEPPAAEPAAPAAPAEPSPAPEPAAQAAPPDPAPAPAPEPPQQTAKQEQASASEPAADSDEDEPAGAYVTPLVRKLASEHGVDLASVTGTGVGGRIRKSDILAAASAASTAAQEAPAPPAEAPAPAPAAAPAPPAPAPAASAPAATPAAAAAPAPAATPPTPKVTAATAPAPAQSAPATAEPAAARGRTEKLSRRRALIAARMIQSLQTSAQLTTVVEVDVTKIARLRTAAKSDFEAREGVKLSFLPFFAQATIEALKVHPGINASIDTSAGTVTYHDAVNLGMAVDTEQGLVVPVIHNAGDLNLGGLARKIADLAGRTRSNKISPDELSGATFSLTNTGSRGALFDTPIFTPPQVGILGTGAVVKRAVVVSDPNIGETIAVRSMVFLAMSYDHQIVDGADAARFLNTIKDRLENGAFEGELGLT